MGHDLLVAFSLLLVFEGILPFMSPDTMRRSLTLMINMENRSLRAMGLFSMLAGVALLYAVN